MTCLWIRCLAVACLLGLSGQALGATRAAACSTETGAMTPIGFLRSHDARAEEILAPAPDDSLSADLREQIKAHINTAFDFAELSRLALGDHWSERSPAERAEFVAVFSNIIREGNFDTFLNYYRKGTIDYRGEEISGTRATVDAVVPLDQGDEIELVYKLHQVHGRWRVYDLVIDDASSADGHCRRHARYLKKHTYDELIQALRNQLERLSNRD